MVRRGKGPVRRGKGPVRRGKGPVRMSLTAGKAQPYQKNLSLTSLTTLVRLGKAW